MEGATYGLLLLLDDVEEFRAPTVLEATFSRTRELSVYVMYVFPLGSVAMLLKILTDEDGELETPVD